ncbi:MAG: sensor histidine kinase [Polyangiales bacterium]
MKLAGKLILALTLVILAVISMDAAVRVRREIELFENDMRNDARFTGQALGHAVGLAYRDQGPAVGAALVKEIDGMRGDVGIRWLWLDIGGGSVVSTRLPPSRLRALMQGRLVSVREQARRGGSGALITYVPVDVSGAGRGAIEITESLAAENDYISTTLRDTVVRSIALLGASILVVSAIGVFFVGRPAGALVAKTRRIGAGDLGDPLELSQHDEMGQLARELNAMCVQLAAANENLRVETNARIAALEQLRHADRLATVGKLASGIAHELGTPLNVVTGRAQMIAAGEASGREIEDNARIVVEQAKRIAQIIRQLLDFARKRTPARVRMDLRVTVEHVLALLGQIADRRGVKLALDTGVAPSIALADEGQIQQVLMNVVGNAIQATERGGTVGVTLSTRRIKPPPEHGGPVGVYTCVSVKDTGCGMDPATAERVFEPFFTTKNVGEGTGLGLSVAYGIIRDHGGFILVDSEIGKGSEFGIHLPPANTEGGA